MNCVACQYHGNILACSIIVQVELQHVRNGVLNSMQRCQPLQTESKGTTVKIMLVSFLSSHQMKSVGQNFRHGRVCLKLNIVLLGVHTSRRCEMRKENENIVDA